MDVDKREWKKFAETENTFDQSFLLFRFSVPSNAHLLKIKIGFQGKQCLFGTTLGDKIL